MLRFKSDIFSITAIFVLSLLMGFPLLHTGEVVSGHDMQFAFMKAVAMHQAFFDGYFLVRWVPDVLHGYGNPMFNFYQPLVFYITAAFAYIFPLVLAFNFVIFLFLFASGVAMYFFAKELWGREGALVSAAAYLFAPYHILDIYVRGAVSEGAAFFFIPLVFLSALRLSRYFF